MRRAGARATPGGYCGCSGGRSRDVPGAGRRAGIDWGQAEIPEGGGWYLSARTRAEAGGHGGAQHESGQHLVLPPARAPGPPGPARETLKHSSAGEALG